MAFNFGKNWRDYLDHTNVERNAREMQESLDHFIGAARIRGATFLDIGCGSGLASLSAIRLGAKSVVSIDISAESVGCTEQLRAKEGIDPKRWRIERGSILDSDFAERLPESDIVYAWGVLHHTGDMKKAFEEACRKVKPGGAFHVAIYNRTRTSPMWRELKQIYNRRSALGRAVMHNGLFVYSVLRRASLFQHPLRNIRGMNVYYDAIDWIGGYPYEYAKPAEVEALVKQQGTFTLSKSRTTKGIGCNEFLFARTEASSKVKHAASSKH